MTEKLSVRMKTLAADISDSALKHRAMYMGDLVRAMVELAEEFERLETPDEPEAPEDAETKPRPRGRRAAK